MPAGGARRPFLGVLAAGALLAGGCEDETPRTGELEHARNAVRTLLDLCAAQKASAIPDLLTAAAEDVYITAGGALEGCQAVLRLADEPGVPDAHLYGRARIVAASRDGDYASVVVQAGDRRSELHVRDSGRRWVISNPPLFEPVSAAR